MIDDKFLLRKFPNQLNRSRKLTRINQDIVSELETLQLPNAAYKIRPPQKPIFRLRLCNMTNSSQLFESRKIFQPLFNLGRSQIYPSNNPRNPTIPLRQPQQILRLRFRLIRLHRNRRVDSVRIQIRHEIARQEIASDRRHLVRNPSITNRIEPPEMLMSVDNH